MRVQISARHCEITEQLRERTEVVVDRLAQLTPFGQEAAVVFGTEPSGQTVEIRLRLSGGQMLVASGEAPDHRTALDLAEARVRRQLERPTAKAGRKHRGALPA